MNIILKFLSKFFNVKYKVAIKDFYNEVHKISKQYNQNYCIVHIEYGGHPDKNGKYEFIFKGYINGFNYETGNTVEEVCQKLVNYKEQNNTIISKVEDVVYD
jgi:hypothetical protein